MNTILTDDELPPMPDGTHPQSMLGQMLRKYADAREAAVLAKLARQEPVAWMYTLEYGANIANTKVSLSQLNYPFGVCGADYLPRNGDGMSYVRQTPLYTHPAPQQADRQRVPEGWLEDAFREGWAKCRDAEIVSKDEEDWQFGNSTANARALAAAPEAPAQASAVDERAAFEEWVAQNAFNFERDPIGSRDCGLQWKAWQARAALAQKGGAT